jgi:hypothetical protein
VHGLPEPVNGIVAAPVDELEELATPSTGSPAASAVIDGTSDDFNTTFGLRAPLVTWLGPDCGDGTTGSCIPTVWGYLLQSDVSLLQESTNAIRVLRSRRPTDRCVPVTTLLYSSLSQSASLMHRSPAVVVIPSGPGRCQCPR